MRALLLTIVASLSIWAHASLAPAQSPDLDALPSTVDDVVHDIVSRLTADEKARIKSTGKEDLILFHHGWGTNIRNHYGLWQGNEKLIHSACGKSCHPDDASMIIIIAVWQKLQ